ncbi:TIR domain-containing protein [Chryseobacterium sp. Tr-659]|uniref:TIR domain-containing protein n=1 Tax=Chryseobacterium sp. Tr-659 TaxID=2608340 RepID=UPI00142357D6|nr:TIR domain-containing protein [Chryseobacterium sp. Tr-659]NIF05025.1 TIR domain-containing protein [Chryseobacterium sp. Tr-659]
MEKPRAIRNFEILNNIELSETTGGVFRTYLPNQIKNVYKLNQDRQVIALNICNNTFKKIEGIFLFDSLEELYINGNQLENLFFLELLPKLRILNTSDNLINDSMTSVYLNNLEELYISNNILSEFPTSQNFPKLRLLYLNKNNINKILTKDIFTNLEILNLDDNKIEKIENMEFFPKLVDLSCINNNIKRIENLDVLKLEELNLSGNEIKKIENLESQIKLKSLSLYNNSIEKIQNLKNPTLDFLNLSNNKIEVIENLENLVNLRVLFLWLNKINKIQGLDKLINLINLNLWSNNINEIEGLNELKNLNTLDVGANNLTKIDKIDNLKKLKDLDIASNKISRIEQISHLISLLTLNISNNLIEDLKDCEELLNTNLKNLKIQSNPFLEKKNILLNKNENHLDTIKNELEKLEKSKEPIKLPVKVMLLGNHASGKSTFLDYFLNDKIENKNESTHILKIINYPKNYKRRISKLPSAIFYDFGGQDYYHGVYKAFLTLDTINLLFWQNKTDNITKEIDSKKLNIINFNKQYWLHQIEFANSQRKKYLKDNTEEVNYVIQTHSDISSQKNPIEENIKQTFFLSFLENYKSRKNEFALKHLKESIIEEIKSHSKEAKKTQNEIALYRFINDYKKSEWTNVEKLVEIYDSSLGNLKAELEQLSMKGMILYYKNIPSLEDFVWLNPSKTVEKIHEILSQQNKGKINKIDFESQINDDKIIDMLKENKVIFFDDYDDHYIIPGYLDFAHEENEEFFYFAEFDSPNFILKFSRFIPFGFINQLICHFGKNPEKKVYWRNQLIFTHQNARIRIKINFELLEIRVFIKSPKKSLLKDIEKEIFLDILYLYWDESIPTLENLKTRLEKVEEIKKENYYEPKDLVKEKEQIFERVIDDLFISIDGGKTYIKHSILQTLEKRSLTISTYNFVEGILNDVGSVQVTNFKNFTNNTNIKAMKKIFISYSRKDGEFKDELKKHLNMLKLFDIADNWSCEQITIGNWHNQIQKELEESDMIVYMLSKNFFNSKYILEQEVQKGIEQMDSNSKKKILGVIVGSFPSLDMLKASSSDRDNLQDSILRLAENQYLPYGNINNNTSGLTENKIIPLDIYNKICVDGNLDTAFQQIAEKISDMLK